MLSLSQKVANPQISSHLFGWSKIKKTQKKQREMVERGGTYQSLSKCQSICPTQRTKGICSQQTTGRLYTAREYTQRGCGQRDLIDTMDGLYAVVIPLEIT